ncbi:MAG: beta-galactosidase, partial [Burkholderiales bacterium]|nr:beta-galactosidase [Bacteroidia bacterium]
YTLKLFLNTLFLAFFCFGVYAQNSNQHEITLLKKVDFINDNHFKQGTHISPEGKELSLNNYFLTMNGKPFFPVMGEFHYSRYPKAEWEEAILKMKAAGITTIAFYDFWIHHEEEQGRFRFDDNRDVRYFIELLAKHHLYGVARIGPWAHGEARNGGYPDWFLKKMTNGFDRVTKNGSVEPEVKIWYGKLAEQFKGLYFKDGGPLIGIQLDNEVGARPGNDGSKYLLALKQIAVDLGIDVPLYVVTGWPGPQVPEDDVLPLWGGYPDAPWTQNTKDLPPNKLYTFVTDRRDKNIGNDVLKYSDNNTPIYRHPFLTVELGGGMQVTYHRRPTLLAGDLLALDYTRLGVGANMLGYYVFHGTQHPLSWNQEFSTEESKSSIFSYPNDYPKISYDFEAPITEWGYIRDYYHDFKLLHQFIAGYGEDLAPMIASIPTDNPENEKDFQKLRYSIRSAAGAGYIFFNNYIRHFDMANQQDVSFLINTGNENLRIPNKGSFNIQNKEYGIIPFNKNMDGILMKYALAHPAAIIPNGNQTLYTYYAIEGTIPEFSFDAHTVKKVEVSDGKIVNSNGLIIINNLKPGKNCLIKLQNKTGETISILLLKKEEALHSYVFPINGKATLLLTDKLAFYDEVKDKLTIRSSGEDTFDIYSYPTLQSSNAKIKASGKEGLFQKYQVKFEKFSPDSIPFKDISNTSAFKQYLNSLDKKTPEGPTYDVIHNTRLPYLNYELNLPKAIPADVHDLKIELNYEGNTAAIYANHILIVDNYYVGEPMIYSLKRNEALLKDGQFVMQITPLMEEAEIH